MSEKSLLPASPRSLCELISALGAGNLDVRHALSKPDLLPSTLNAEAEALCQDREAARQALRELLPGEAPPEGDVFYSRLMDFGVLLLQCPTKDKLLGILLSESYRRWGADGERLLRDLNSHGHAGFFMASGALPTFLSENELPAEFAAGWLVETLDRLGNDMISGGFWGGLKEFARHYPERASEIASLLSGNAKAGENALSVAATLFGVCRGAVAPGEAVGALATLDTEWANSRRPQHRVYHQRSWIATANERALAPAELEALLAVMSEGTDDEYVNAFYVVTSCLQSPKTDAPTRDVGLAWLREQVAPTLPPFAKHHVIRFATGEGVADLDDLLLAVQPIAPEHGNTWFLIMAGLTRRLHEVGEKAFRDLLTSLAEASGAAFLQALASDNVSAGLISALSPWDCGGLLVDLLFSPRPVLRRLGFFLLEHLPLPAVPADVLAGKTDVQVLLSLLELRGKLLVTRGQTIADFLLMLAPRVETADTELRAEFEAELLLQAKNFPGACLERFKAAAGVSALIANTVTKAEAYFEALRAAQGNPLTAMQVPGMKQASKRHARRFSHTIHKESEEKSVFAQLFKQVHLLYGDQFAFDQGGEIEPQPFQKFSFEMEVPRLEFIDPEAMLQRRVVAQVDIARLERELAGQPTTPPLDETT